MTTSFKLYPYQEEAVQAMMQKTGFILADDMGLGKTVTQLDEIRRRNEDRDTMRVLVVCPKTVIGTWWDHSRAFGYDPLIHLPRTAPKITQSTLFVITNWDQLRVNSTYKRVAWTYVVGDEAHNAKNRKAKRTQNLWTIPAMYRRALTGTPIMNRPDEIWAILHWLYPERYRSYWKFYDRYVDWEKHPFHQYRIVKGARNVDELKEELAPIMLRRLKGDVRKDIPEKRPPQKIRVDLNPQQRRVYDQMRKDALAWVGKNEDKPLAAKMVVAQLMRLRQIALGTPIDVWEEEGKTKVRIGEPSAKLDALMDIIEGTDKPILVYTNFRSGVEMTVNRCKEKDISCVHLLGGMPDHDRQKAIESFGKGSVRVLVATLGTGGEGVDGLQRSCSTVVFLDRHFTPGRNTQAEDRLHRGGQTEPVNVIHIDANQTVDQQVEAKIEWKWSFIRQILGG